MGASPLLFRDRSGAHPERLPFAVRQPFTALPPGKGSKARRKLWEVTPNLHCSIIGTCLTTSELRTILERCHSGRDLAQVSDHDLHMEAVRGAAGQNEVSRSLQKALDRRHQGLIGCLDRAKTPQEMLALWEEAKHRGDIPGGYWAVITHRKTDQATLTQVFGEVHMLSHLVGAANRADIGRLTVLEQERARLHLKCERQQAHLGRAIRERDEALERLQRSAATLVPDVRAGNQVAELRREMYSLRNLAEALQGRLHHEALCRERTETAVKSLQAELLAVRGTASDAIRREQQLQEELSAVTRRLSASEQLGSRDGSREDLDGLRVLFVGGRAAQIHELRACVEKWGGEFHHHDGGLEDRRGLLAGMIDGCDAVFFPVDCISHDAVDRLKRSCRRGGKPFVPLRSASLASLIVGLRRLIDARGQPETQASTE